MRSEIRTRSERTFMDIKKQLAEEFSLKEEHCSNIVNLLDDGNTVPFIARYRKEMHGGTDDQVIRELRACKSARTR